jgi:polar amino acid transport system substrate-binding protein
MTFHTLLILTRRITLIILTGLACFTRAETLVIAADIWCPINCTPDVKRPGIFVELARDIFAEAGITVDYKVMNWARTLYGVRRGELNAVIGAGIEDAPDFIFTATPIAHSHICFYTRSDSTWRFSGIPSLTKVRVGVINDYSYDNELDAYIDQNRSNSKRIQVVSGDKALERNLDKLRRERLDTVLENRWVLQAMLTQQGMQGELREAGCSKSHIPIYLAFFPGTSLQRTLCRAA